MACNDAVAVDVLALAVGGGNHCVLALVASGEQLLELLVVDFLVSDALAGNSGQMETGVTRQSACDD